MEAKPRRPSSQPARGYFDSNVYIKDGSLCLFTSNIDGGPGTFLFFMEGQKNKTRPNCGVNEGKLQIMSLSKITSVSFQHWRKTWC